ncbi:MAG: hypothetical protein HOV87_09945 [Catenulispora sp.]|nr:hypothetical protein [Catenulispora sp.]
MPAPKAATLKEDGWEPIADFDAATISARVPGHFFEAGLRHIARRGWIAPDGQHTVVELLQFPDHQAAYALETDLVAGPPQAFGKPEKSTATTTLTVPNLGDTTEDVTVQTFDSVEGHAGQVARRAVFRTGDVVAIVTATGPEKVGTVALDQEIMLQAELLR